MPVIDLVKWDGNPALLAWKYPSEELSTNTQLIVNETQEAFLVRGGVYEGPFLAGRHTLESQNLPLLRGVIGLPFGGETPFTAEVWFVNRITNLNVRWGTTDPMQIVDPRFNVMLPVRATAQYGIETNDSKRLLLKLVGKLPVFDIASMREYLNGILSMKIKRTIAASIIDRGISILEASMYLDEFSSSLEASLKPDLDEYGLSLSQFSIVSINVPENDAAVIQLKSALAERAGYDILQTTYQQRRSFDVLESAASNEGTSGSVMGTGLGLGLGVGIGGPIGNSIGQVGSVMSTSATPSSGIPSEMADILRLIEDAGKQVDAGRMTIEEFEVFKRRLLGEL